MSRPLNAEERALWRKVAATVRPLEATSSPEPGNDEPPPRASRPGPQAPPSQRSMGATLDAGWDRRLSRGLVRPDRTIDLHGHGLAAAHALLEARLEDAIAGGARLVLLITGRPPRGDSRPYGRGVIRASIGDWLAASRHAGHIAAVRTAHPRHGGAGALYVVLRRRRERP